MHRLVWLFAFAIALCVAIPDARAQDVDRNAARALADAGATLYDQGDYEKALDRFQSAERLFHAPPLVLFIARCQAKLGRVSEAMSTYEKLIAEELAPDAPAAFRDAQTKAKTELSELEATIPTITVNVVGPPPGAATVTVDGKPASPGAPVRLKVGTFRVTASADGFESMERSVELVEGSHEEVSLELVSLGGSDEAPPDDTTGEEASTGIALPAAMIALGGVGLIIGAIAGGAALGKADDLKTACPTRMGCTPEAKELEDSARTLGTVSTVSFVVGGVCAAGGIVWLILELTGDEGGEETESAVRMTTDGTTLGIEARF